MYTPVYSPGEEREIYLISRLSKPKRKGGLHGLHGLHGNYRLPRQPLVKGIKAVDGLINSGVEEREDGIVHDG